MWCCLATLFLFLCVSLPISLSHCRKINSTAPHVHASKGYGCTRSRPFTASRTYGPMAGSPPPHGRLCSGIMMSGVGGWQGRFVRDTKITSEGEGGRWRRKKLEKEINWTNKGRLRRLILCCALNTELLLPALGNEKTRHNGLFLKCCTPGSLLFFFFSGLYVS